MQKQYIIASDADDGRQRGEKPPWQSKCENRTAILTKNALVRTSKFPLKW